MKMIPIVFSTDHNFVMPTGVTICSLLLNANNTIYDIYVMISPDVTDEDKEKLKRQVLEISSDSKISFVEMGNQFSDGYEVRGISTACYFRLMIPWLIPSVDKIIYCDVDVVIKTSLADLYDIDLEDKYVAGAERGKDGGWIEMRKYFNKLGIDYREYINSGVLVINSQLQRRDNLKKKYIELSKNKYLYQDQDIINIVCKGRISQFSYRYNFNPSLYGIDPNMDSKVLIHYFGDKPWRGFTYAWVQWWEIYRKSVFYDSKFYHEVSSKIISPTHQLKTMRRKSLEKAKQIISKLF